MKIIDTELRSPPVCCGVSTFVKAQELDRKLFYCTKCGWNIEFRRNRIFTESQGFGFSSPDDPPTRVESVGPWYVNDHYKVMSRKEYDALVAEITALRSTVDQLGKDAMAKSHISHVVW